MLNVNVGWKQLETSHRVLISSWSDWIHLLKHDYGFLLFKPEFNHIKSEKLQFCLPSSDFNVCVCIQEYSMNLICDNTFVCALVYWWVCLCVSLGCLEEAGSRVSWQHGGSPPPAADRLFPAAFQHGGELLWWPALRTVETWAHVPQHVHVLLYDT